MLTRGVVCFAAVMALAGCGNSGASGPRHAVIAFAQALSTKQAAAACALLAPETRHDLESSAGKPCADSILDQQLPASTSVRTAEQWGTEGRVVLDKDVAFVARFSIGWRVVAAGCDDRGPKLPYDCTLKGG